MMETKDDIQAIIPDVAEQSDAVIILPRAKEQMRHNTISSRDVRKILKLGDVREGPYRDMHGMVKIAMGYNGHGQVVFSYSLESDQIIVTSVKG